MKNLNILKVRWKIQLLGRGGSRKTNIEEGGLPKGGGAWQERGRWCFWGGVGTPMHTMIFQVNNTWLVSVTPSTIPAPLLLALNSSLPTELLLSLILVTQLQFPLWEKVSENTSNYQQQTLKTYPFILVIIKITLLILIDSDIFWACGTYDRTFFYAFLRFLHVVNFFNKMLHHGCLIGS